MAGQKKSVTGPKLEKRRCGFCGYEYECLPDKGIVCPRCRLAPESSAEDVRGKGPEAEKDTGYYLFGGMISRWRL